VRTANQLIERTGFQASFDGELGAMQAEPPLHFRRVVRRKADIAEVLFDGAGMNDETELYWIFQLIDAGPHTRSFEDRSTTFACVLLPGRKIGREYVKTQGHYHPAMPGISLEYPEVYSHLFGDVYLLMQRKSDDRPESLDDCVLIDMRAWGSVTIPPGYAHVLINSSPEPAAVAGLYCTRFQPDYQPFARMAGAAYFLIDDGGECIIDNPRYDHAPVLRRPASQADADFVAPDPSRPLWTSYLRDPDRYAFVAESAAALAKFGTKRRS
jgi:glucose-6-phosphate isomerase, archaeal